MNVPEMAPTELANRIAAGDALVLLDVREPHELGISRLDSVVAMPMGEVVDRLNELDPSAETVVICRSGSRSRQIASLLLESGFHRVWNLATGMNGWAETVDPTVQTY